MKGANMGRLSVVFVGMSLVVVSLAVPAAMTHTT